MLRHAVATLAYRGGKALRDAPDDFGSTRVSIATNSALDTLSHIGDLLEWALSITEGQERWPESATRAWGLETERFFAGLARLDAYLASGECLGATPEKLFQGPIADALTHVGQLATLRRLAGAPVRGENYYVADIEIGRVGPEQAAARREFD